MINELDRAAIIIETLKQRVFELEEALLSGRVDHAMTRLAYQQEAEAATSPENE